jgi:hypothetical protein
MRHAIEGRTPPDVHHPLPKYSGVNEGAAPKGVRDRRKVAAYGSNSLVLDEADQARRDCPKAAIQHAEVNAVEVRDIALKLKRQDLTLATAGNFVSAPKAIQEDTATRWPIAFSHNVLVRPEVKHLHGQVSQRLPFVRGYNGYARQLANKRVNFGGRSFCQIRPPNSKAGARSSLRQQHAD